jgi:tetraacyldisaccharide 4'-kinase
VLKSSRYGIPVICVGNLAVGGTGKTPLVDYLLQLLSHQYRIAVLSRGYKRKSTGYILANEQSTSVDIGDEACQIKQKYPHVIVAVDSKRCRGMNHLLAMPEDVRPQVVLLDDGFQHRYVKPSLSILITDFNRLYYQDKLLPAGRLREPAKSATRADIIVISKCPEYLCVTDCMIIENEIHPAPHQPLFFTGIAYQPFKNVFFNDCYAFIQQNDEVLLITGIANPTLIIEEIKRYSDNVTVMPFNDHHEFSKKDIVRMKKTLSKMTRSHPWIICTEKDAARIRTNPHFPDEWKLHLNYLPIKVNFLFDQHEQFDNLIMKHIALTDSCKELI